MSYHDNHDSSAHARGDSRPPAILPSVAAHTKPSLRQRQSSTFRYHTFPTAPPRNAGPPQGRRIKDSGSSSSPSRGSGRSSGSHMRKSSQHEETPLPKRQLAALAVIALAEQTALNSISPYLPDMASSFPDVNQDKVGLYVGLIASAFALAQFATNFLWGWMSDRVGRKPIVLTGTLLTAVCFVAFGFCRTLWQAVLVQALMGLVNGNQGVISTCLGEITDRSNQSRAFTYLPVIYGIGGITGPIVGGLLVLKKSPFDADKQNPYPYLAPNLVSAAVLMIDFVITVIFLEESLQQARNMPPLKKRVGTLFTWLWQFTSSHRPTYMRHRKTKAREQDRHVNGNNNATPHDEEYDNDSTDEDSEESASLLPHHSHHGLTSKEVFNRDTVLLLITFLIFQLSNISFNSLYPIFAQGPAPTGRDLNPEEIGISLAFAGVITIVFQVGIFGRLREKVGNKASYRTGLAGFVVAFLLMPWVGYKDNSASGSHKGSTVMGKVWLWVELGVVLIVKTVAAVGGLTSALLLITNSAPSHAVLGTINGLAQTLSAAGRAVGPFISGGLYTAATHVQPKGEALAFGVFGGIAFLGLLMSFGIRGADLEGADWAENDEEEAVSDEDEDADEPSNR